MRPTFEDAAALWLEASQGEWKPKTRRRYDQSLTVLLPYLQPLFWDQVNKSVLQTFIEDRKRLGASVATINRDLTVVSGIAKHVRELDGWPDHNPVEALPVKPRKAKRWVYVRPPVEDVEAYFARMQGTFGDLCRFALLTGARMDEIRFLKRQDVIDGRAQFWDTKSKLPRVIQLSPEARAIAERQKPRHGCPYLFVTSRGGAYKRVTEMWREVVIRAQKMALEKGRTLTRMRFHDLRHEYAIRELERARPIMLLRDHLGHGTVGQTERYLAYLTPEQAGIVRGT